jgi:hypothetical protein
MGIDNKFKIGDIVQVYENILVKVKCPLCEGKHSIKNPSSHYLLSNKKILECPFCDVEGNIALEQKKERRLSPIVYRVRGIESHTLEGKTVIFYRLESLSNEDKIILRPEKDLKIAAIDMDSTTNTNDVIQKLNKFMVFNTDITSWDAGIYKE